MLVSICLKTKLEQDNLLREPPQVSTTTLCEKSQRGTRLMTVPNGNNVEIMGNPQGYFRNKVFNTLSKGSQRLNGYRSLLSGLRYSLIPEFKRFKIFRKEGYKCKNYEW